MRGEPSGIIPMVRDVAMAPEETPLLVRHEVRSVERVRIGTETLGDQAERGKQLAADPATDTVWAMMIEAVAQGRIENRLTGPYYERLLTRCLAHHCDQLGAFSVSEESRHQCNVFSDIDGI